MSDKKKDSELAINVMMVGGRRCGKTSVLAAMQSCFESQLAMTPFTIEPADSWTMETLEEKQSEIQEYFIRKGNQRSFVPDSNPTSEKMEYAFYIKLKGSGSRMRINLIDYPGEWLNDTGKLDEIKNMMSKSRILLIAIDTPHLMEEEGLYNDARNRCYRISQMVKNTEFANVDKGAGLILLIPLKCEKYYNEGRMDMVSSRTKEAYEPLIQYVRQPDANGKRSLCQVAVTPILTMGGAQFSFFERDENFEIAVDPKYKMPTKAIYRFPDMTKTKPEPQYCEQPLLYVLEFTFCATQSMLKKKAKNPLNKLSDTLKQILKAAKINPLFTEIAGFLMDALEEWTGTEDYLRYAKDVSQKLKTFGDGYEIVVNSTYGVK